MKKTGLAGELLFILLLSGCAQGPDTLATGTPEKIEQEEQAEEAEADQAEEAEAEEEQAGQNEAAEEDPTEEEEEATPADDSLQTVEGAFVETIDCGYLGEGHGPESDVLYRISTEEESYFAEVYYDLSRPLNLDELPGYNVNAADAYQELKAKYPLSEYDYLICYSEYCEGGHSHHADSLVVDGDTICFHYDEVRSPEDGFAPDVMDGEIDMAAVPKAFFEGKKFRNLWQTDSLYMGGEEDPIDEDYIAVFRSGGFEYTKETYVYETEKGYRYVHVESMTVSWGSPQWKHMIRSYGEVETREEVAERAKANGAYEYVMYPGDSAVYTVSEFLGAK